MDFTRELQIVDASGTKRAGSISGHFEESTHECELSLHYESQEYMATGMDFWEAFRIIRGQLDSRKLVPVCYGACQNVWPSGMLLDMCLGLAANILGTGERFSPEVDIFASGPNMELGSVDAQAAWVHAWYKG